MTGGYTNHYTNEELRHLLDGNTHKCAPRTHQQQQQQCTRTHSHKLHPLITDLLVPHKRQTTPTHLSTLRLRLPLRFDTTASPMTSRFDCQLLHRRLIPACVLHSSLHLSANRSLHIHSPRRDPLAESLRRRVSNGTVVLAVHVWDRPSHGRYQRPVRRMDIVICEQDPEWHFESER